MCWCGFGRVPRSLKSQVAMEEIGGLLRAGLKRSDITFTGFCDDIDTKICVLELDFQ